MDKTKENTSMNCNTLDELLTAEFGAVGTPIHDEFKEERFCFFFKLLGKSVRYRS